MELGRAGIWGRGQGVGVDRLMGIRFYCPNGHKLNVKEFQAGLRGICPYCGAKIQIPTQSTRPPSKKNRKKKKGGKQRSLPVVTTSDTGGPIPTAAPPASVGAGSAVGQPKADGPAAPTGQAPPVAVGQPAPAAGSAGGTPGQSSPVVAVQDSTAPPATPPFSSPGAPAATFSSPPMSAAGEAATPTAPAGVAPSGAVDPLVEAGDVVWYVRPASGGQFGPATGDVMRTWIGEGRVAADSLIWREGWRDWRQASEVFPQLAAGQVQFSLGDANQGGGSATPATVHGSRPRARRHSRTTQVMVITVLILAVLILSVVFLLVVTGTVGGQARTATESGVQSVAWHQSVRCLFPPAVGPPSAQVCA